MIDTETTGLTGRVWEFSAVSVVTRQSVLTFRCHPGDAPWSPVAAEMAGERYAECHREPPAAQFAEVLARLLEGLPLLAYNAPFDRAAVARTWPELELPRFECVMRAYAPLSGKTNGRGGPRVCRLREALEREGVPDNGFGAHDAFGDALATVDLIRMVAGLR